MHNVCVAVTLNDAQKFDFEAFLADFSTTIFPLFVWNVWILCRVSRFVGEM